MDSIFRICEKKCSLTAFENWLAPIKVLDSSADSICLEVPNIFVKAYLLDNYRKDLCAFVPVNAEGEPAIEFIISDQPVRKQQPLPARPAVQPSTEETEEYELKLNPSYRFDNFIEGPSNQFVKSAAMGIANKPGRSYNPLFIHGGVGLGKTPSTCHWPLCTRTSQKNTCPMHHHRGVH